MGKTALALGNHWWPVALPHLAKYTGVCYYNDFRGYTAVPLHSYCHILALSGPLRHLSWSLCPAAPWILSSHYIPRPPGRLNKPRHTIKQDKSLACHFVWIRDNISRGQGVEWQFKARWHLGLTQPALASPNGPSTLISLPNKILIILIRPWDSGNSHSGATRLAGLALARSWRCVRYRQP